MWRTSGGDEITLRALARALASGSALSTDRQPLVYRGDVLHFALGHGQCHSLGKCTCLVGAQAPVISVVWLCHEAPERGVLPSNAKDIDRFRRSPRLSGASGIGARPSDPTRRDGRTSWSTNVGLDTDNGKRRRLPPCLVGARNRCRRTLRVDRLAREGTIPSTYGRFTVFSRRLRLRSLFRE
jgi:hypothetical protein